MTLIETVKSGKKSVPYMITYNLSLPNIGEIINKYWVLLALSEKQSVKYVFQQNMFWHLKDHRTLVIFAPILLKNEFQSKSYRICVRL